METLTDFLTRGKVKIQVNEHLESQIWEELKAGSIKESFCDCRTSCFERPFHVLDHRFNSVHSGIS